MDDHDLANADLYFDGAAIGCDASDLGFDEMDCAALNCCDALMRYAAVMDCAASMGFVVLMDCAGAVSVSVYPYHLPCPFPWTGLPKRLL
jgi:hypothetical protein